MRSKEAEDAFEWLLRRKTTRRGTTETTTATRKSGRARRKAEDRGGARRNEDSGGRRTIVKGIRLSWRRLIKASAALPRAALRRTRQCRRNNAAEQQTFKTSARKKAHLPRNEDCLHVGFNSLTLPFSRASRRGRSDATLRTARSCGLTISPLCCLKLSAILLSVRSATQIVSTTKAPAEHAARTAGRFSKSHATIFHEATSDSDRISLARQRLGRAVLFLNMNAVVGRFSQQITRDGK